MSWGAKKQHIISRSSTKAKYCVMEKTNVELTLLTYILKDHRIPLSSPLVLYYDDISALYMTIIHVFHARSKHIKLHYHFVHEHVALGLLIAKYVSFDKQITNIYQTSTKSCSSIFPKQTIPSPPAKFVEGY